MIDRSLTDHPNLSGTDYVLEGASVRDRFLTAFILRHNAASVSLWPHAARMPDSQNAPDLSLLLPDAEEEGFSVEVESAYEPLTIRVIDQWLDADADDEDL